MSDEVLISPCHKEALVPIRRDGEIIFVCGYSHCDRVIAVDLCSENVSAD
jgi:hypothetical protein